MKISVVVCFTSLCTPLVGFSVDTFWGTDIAVKKHTVPWPLLYMLRLEWDLFIIMLVYRFVKEGCDVWAGMVYLVFHIIICDY